MRKYGKNKHRMNLNLNARIYVSYLPLIKTSIHCSIGRLRVRQMKQQQEVKYMLTLSTNI